MFFVAMIYISKLKYGMELYGHCIAQNIIKAHPHTAKLVSKGTLLGHDTPTDILYSEICIPLKLSIIEALSLLLVPKILRFRDYSPYNLESIINTH